MNPCHWWTASPNGEVVFDSVLLYDRVANDGPRGDWARAVAEWTTHDTLTVLTSPMAHAENLSVLRKVELDQINDARKQPPKGPGHLAIINRETIQGLAESMRKFRTTGIPMDGAISKRCLEIRSNVLPYDAWYVAIAERHQAPLFTADERLVESIRHARSPCVVYSFETDIARLEPEASSDRWTPT